MINLDHQTHEISQLLIAVRDDLNVTVQQYGGQACFLIEDPTGGKFFRLGHSEYTFLSLLDGATSFGEALAANANILGSKALTSGEASGLCRWAVESGLATTDASKSTDRTLEKQARQASAFRSRWLNPVCIQMPLFNPRALIQPVAHLTSSLWSQWGFFAWTLFCLFGAAVCTLHLDELAGQTFQIHAASGWLWFGATWLTLKLVHETAHAVCCQRFGGEVRSAGLLWLVFVPLPYVDVTSSWRLRSRRHRILVSAAGMMAELLIASVASIVWLTAESPIVRQQAVFVIVSASVTTLMFNANPLMRFDGYYMLSDWFEMPNLAAHGKREVHRILRRIFFGLGAPRQELPEGRPALVLAYGVLSAVWRVFVCIGLIVAAEVVFHGVGILLAAIAVFHWVLRPGFQLLKFVATGSSTEKPRRLRFAVVSSLVLLVGGLTLTQLRWTQSVRVPAVVEYPELSSIRAATSGAVETIHVSSGEQVHQGQTLVTLSNPELLANGEDLRFAIEQSRLRQRRFHQNGSLAAAQVEAETIKSLEEKLTQVEQLISELTIHAPHAGTVLTTHLEELSGQFVTPGTPLIDVGDDQRVEVLAYVPQRWLNDLDSDDHTAMRVHVWGQGLHSFVGYLTSVNPRAGVVLEHASIASVYGGPLSVRPSVKGSSLSSSEPGAVSPSAQSPQQWRLLEPHSVARIHVEPGDARTVVPGQTGFCEFTSTRYTLGEIVVDEIGGWIEARREAAARQ